MSVEQTVILGAARTPTGAFLGKFGSISATDLGAVAIRCALERAGVSGAEVDEVYMGIVVAAGVGQRRRVRLRWRQVFRCPSRARR